MLITKGVVGYITQELWLPDWYKERRRRAHESARESAIYNTLKMGPGFLEEIDNIIPRDVLVDQVRLLITPSARSRSYPPYCRRAWNWKDKSDSACCE